MKGFAIITAFVCASALFIGGCGGSKTASAGPVNVYFVANGNTLARGFAGSTVAVPLTTGAFEHVRLRPVTKDRLLFRKDGVLTIMGTSGGTQTQLAGFSYGDWAADGNSIYAVTDNNLVVRITLNGTPISGTLLNGNFGAGVTTIDVSNSGTKILLTYEPSGWPRVYTMDTDGSNLTPLTADGMGSGGARWSADDSKIVFVRYAAPNWQVYSMNADGSAQTNLTSDPTTNFLTPSYLNDGRIVFTALSGGSAKVDVINADGSGRATFFDIPGVVESDFTIAE